MDCGAASRTKICYQFSRGIHPQIQDLDLGGQKTFLKPNRPCNRKWFPTRSGPPLGFARICEERTDCMVPGGLWASPFPPKPYQKIIFPTFPNFGKSSGAPLALHGRSLLALCGNGKVPWGACLTCHAGTCCGATACHTVLRWMHAGMQCHMSC